jgi:hypothetical protein
MVLVSNDHSEVAGSVDRPLPPLVTYTYPARLAFVDASRLVKLDVVPLAL